MKREVRNFIFTSFLSWRVALLLFVFLGIAFFPLQNNFLGGGLANYLKNPYFWSLLNFDGEHYAAIAFQGYKPSTYFFFPLYPLLTRLIALIFNKDLLSIAISGVLISNFSFFVALIGFWKLIRLDYKENIAKLSIILLLIFPTSFYFGAFYTESLTLALIVWAFYFARKGNWILVGILGGLASATRITALALIPAIGTEIWLSSVRKPLRVEPLKLLALALIPLGLAVYMYYLYRVTGDPLEFVHNVAIFGEQRSSNLIMLPQVFYRYIFKVLPNINYEYFPVVWTTYLEIGTAILFLVFGAWSFIKLRLSYAIYLAVGYIIPSLSGSFSSLPRYVLILFPAFLLSAIFLEGRSRLTKGVVYLVLLIMLTISCGLFVRGYWVS